jgi:hypothetical protein
VEINSVKNLSEKDKKAILSKEIVNTEEGIADEEVTYQRPDDSSQAAIITGCYNIVKEGVNSVVYVTEIPISMTKKSYRAFLEQIRQSEEDKKQRIEYFDYGKDENINFKILGFKNPNVYTLRLREVISLNNMRIQYKENKIVHFKNYSEILDSFYQWMTPVYVKLYEKMVYDKKAALETVIQKSKLLNHLLNKDLDLVGLGKAKTKELLAKYDIEYSVLNTIDLGKVDKESIEELEAERTKREQEYNKVLEMKDHKSLWVNDLIELRKVLNPKSYNRV